MVFQREFFHKYSSQAHLTLQQEAVHQQANFAAVAAAAVVAAASSAGSGEAAGSGSSAVLASETGSSVIGKNIGKEVSGGGISSSIVSQGPNCSPKPTTELSGVCRNKMADLFLFHEMSCCWRWERSLVR